MTAGYPRSLHVVESDARRGAETHAVELVDYLRGCGHEARAVALRATEGSTAYDLPALGRHARRASTILRLRRHVRSADVVVAHGSTTLPALALATLRTSVPLIYRSIGDPEHWQSTVLRRRRTRVSISRATHIVALYPEARAAWLRLHPGLSAARFSVIPNAVPAEAWSLVSEADRARARGVLGVPTDRPCAAYVGALSAEKDPLAAVEAAALTGAFLLVAGGGPLTGSVQARLDALGGRGRLLGQVADVRGVLAAADVLLAPSRTEGQPAVIIEAGLSGIPVVATRVGGVPELVEEGVSGRTIPAPADGSALAAALTAVLAETTPGTRVATATRMARYTFDHTGPRWQALLERVAVGDRVVSL